MRGKFNVGLLYGLSLAFHGGLAAVVSAIEPPPVVETVHITMREAPPPPEPETPPEPPPEPEPPPPPPPEVETPPPPRPRAEPPPQAPPPPVAQPAAVPEFGVAMQGGVGLGGIAVPVGTTQASPQPQVTRTATARELAAPEEERHAARREEDACAEEASRPRPLSMPQPAYTDDARTALIEGRVRVRITVDGTGTVTDVQVLEGLGHGLDESAIEAVRGASFEPAMRCGEAVPATFTISVRFTL